MVWVVELFRVVGILDELLLSPILLDEMPLGLNRQSSGC